MALKLTTRDAVADAIGSVRTEGLHIAPAHRALLDKMAAGTMTAAQVKRAVIKSVNEASAAPRAKRKAGIGL